MTGENQKITVSEEQQVAVRQSNKLLYLKPRLGKVKLFADQVLTSCHTVTTSNSCQLGSGAA